MSKKSSVGVNVTSVSKHLKHTVVEHGFFTDSFPLKSLVTPSYLAEAEQYLTKTRPQTSTQTVFGQDKTIEDALSRLSTDLPYVALIGEVGIGKSEIQKFILGGLEGRISPDEIEKNHGAIIRRSFDAAIVQSQRFKPREYIVLANLANPLNPICLDFSSTEDAQQNYQVLRDFSEKISKYIGTYPAHFRQALKQQTTKEGLTQYVDQQIAQIFATLYETISLAPEFETINTDNGLFVIRDIKTNGRSNPFSRLKVDVEFKGFDTTSLAAIKDFVNINPKKRGVTRSDIIRSVGTDYMAPYFEEGLASLIHKLTHIEVEGRKRDSVADSIHHAHELVKSRLSLYVLRTRTELTEKYDSEEILSADDAVGYFALDSSKSVNSMRLSEASVNVFVENATTIAGSFIPQVKDERIQRYLLGVTQFFRQNSQTFANGLEDMLNRAEVIEEDNKQKLSLAAKRKSKTKQRSSSRSRSGIDSEKKTLAEIEEDLFKDLKFSILHGRSSYDLKTIFEPVYLRNISCGQPFSVTSITTDFDDSLGIFEEKGDQPPHKQLTALGSFFSGNVLKYDDGFGNFVSEIHGGKNNQLGRFLQYLQTGTMEVVNQGISYNLHSPKMLLAADNSNPFVIETKGGNFTHIPGLASRILQLNVPDVALNDADGRMNTMHIVHRALTSESEKLKYSLTIQPEALHALLQMQIQGLLHMSLSYRELDNFVESLVHQARKHEEKEISLDTIKRETKKKLDFMFFKSPDNHALKTHGYLHRPYQTVGSAYGLAVSSNPATHVFLFESVFRNYGRDARGTQGYHKVFQYPDVRAKLQDETCDKGFELAIDFVTGVLESIIVTGKSYDWSKADWQVKITTNDDWNESGGPSASAIMTASMLSAMSGIPIYKNRFMTGTLQTQNGHIGVIGGTYHKGLSAYRLKEFAKKQGDNTPVYFLFPQDNALDLSRNLHFDPFNLAQNVACIPVPTIQQAFYLLTCSKEITYGQLESLDSLAQNHWESMKEKIAHNVGAK
jgi:hypothetical protein